MLTADNLYKIRKVLDLTQTDVAALADVSIAYINQIEHHKRPLTDRVRMMITEELNLTPERIRRMLELYSELERVR